MNSIPDENTSFAPTEPTGAPAPEATDQNPGNAVSADHSSALKNSPQGDLSSTLKTEVRYLRDIVAISPLEAETKVLQTEVLYLRNIVACLEYERDDLRRRLDAESGDRRTITAMLMVALPAERRTDYPHPSTEDTTSHQTGLTQPEDTVPVLDLTETTHQSPPLQASAGFPDDFPGLPTLGAEAAQSASAASPAPQANLLDRLKSSYLRWLSAAVLTVLLILLTKFLFDVFEPFA